jgi:CubicO group peptidase (beta-lactamase class C family)
MKPLKPLCLVCLFVLAACQQDLDPSERNTLTADALHSTGNLPDGPVANRHFMPANDAVAALHEFNGVLRISEHPMRTQPSPIEPTEIAGKQTGLFPAVDLGFITHRGHLLPVDRGILAGTGESFWQISIEPGKTWSEPRDGDMSRASFPFVLTSNIENETYHGLATFLFNEDAVSGLYYQVVHQLSPYMVQTWFTAAGQVNVQRLSLEANAEELIAAFERELAERLPWRPWSELSNRYGEETLADFNSGIDPANTVISGLLLDGRFYLHSANTAYGPYPYPEGMRLGIWSVSKTVGGLVALMRMAQKYGDEVLDYRIREYLAVTAEHGGWEDVRFRDALNMATGIGTGSTEVNPNRIEVDYLTSDVDEYMAWYLAPTLAEKLEYVFRSPSYPWGPGEHVRYRDRDTFILAAALDSLLKLREGDGAELWRMLQEEVYEPIGVSHIQSTGTKDADRSMVPFLGWGVYATVDDLLKIALLLQRLGEHEGRQLLSVTGLREAFYETPVRGLPTGAVNKYGPKTYHLSLWHENFIAADGTIYTVPKMVGWGGVILQLMPNGMVGLRIGNGGAPDEEDMVRIADRIRPFKDSSRR